MKRTRISELSDVTDGHVLKEYMSGDYIYHGGLSFSQPGGRSHSHDGPEGKDFHVHEDCEAFVILQGKGWLELDKELHPLSVGDIVIVEPGEDHHLIADQENPLVTLYCHAGFQRKY